MELKEKTRRFALAVGLVLGLSLAVEAVTTYSGQVTQQVTFNGVAQPVSISGLTQGVSVPIVSTNTLTMQGTASDNSANSTAKLPVISARANAAAPTFTEGFQVPLSVDLAGNLRTSASLAFAQGVSLPIVSTNTLIVNIPAGTTLPVVSTTPVVAQPYAVATQTVSSQTVTTASVQIFAADAARRTYTVTSLPTNTDYVYCRWGAGSAVTTDALVLSPGSNLTPSLAVETLALSCISASGSQVVRGISWDQ